MIVVEVGRLKKYYRVHKREPGLFSSLRSLVKREYEDVKAVDEISFQIEEGELVGFIGPNGAGKTTTLKCLAGLLYPTAGFLSVLGFTPWERKPAFLRQISLVMGQKNQLWWDLPPIETFILNREIYEIPPDRYQENLDKLCSLLEIGDILKVPVRKLSLGQRMKCELVAALLHSPRVLFLDEPTVGLDVVMQKKMRGFIREYNRRYKSTILLTSHYMEDVKELCRRVIIINKGKIVYDGSLSEMVKRYADYKIVKAVFAEEIDPKGLEKIGEVKKYCFPHVVFSIPRETTSLAASELLRKFPVADLDITEPPIEEIIRKIFTGKNIGENSQC